MLTYKNSSSHLRIRQGIYHFVRRVPSDLQQYYTSDRVSLSLKTRSHNHALRTASSINQRLDDYWLGLRLKEMDVPALHLLVEDGKENEHSSPTILEAADIYLRIKRNSNPTFVRAVKRNTKYLVKALGKPEADTFHDIITPYRRGIIGANKRQCNHRRRMAFWTGLARPAMRCQDTKRDSMSASCQQKEWTLQIAWRGKYRSKDRGRTCSDL